jgi:membrane-associated phospholipid phosphatase
MRGLKNESIEAGAPSASFTLFAADQRYTLQGKVNYGWGLLQMILHTRRRRRFPVALKVKHFTAWATFCVVIGVSPIRAAADEAFSAKSALEDTKLYFTAPLRWDQEDWVAFGGALVAIGVAHQFDAKVRDHFATGSKAILNGGEDKNSLRDAAPTAALLAGTGLYAAFIRDSDGYRETWALLEAGILSGTTAEVLGLAGGRERPDATTSPNQWRQGGDSFPSLHVSTAFAIGTVFAESGNDEYRWIRRVIGYGVAGATSYVRVDENVHWLSDTVAGAALGIATARFVLNRQNAETHASVQFEPIKNGWRVSYSMHTH